MNQLFGRFLAVIIVSFLSQNALAIECKKDPSYALQPGECLCIGLTCKYHLLDVGVIPPGQLADMSIQDLTGFEFRGFDIQNTQHPAKRTWIRPDRHNGYRVIFTAQEEAELANMANVISAIDQSENAQDRIPLNVNILVYKIHNVDYENFGIGFSGFFLENGLSGPTYGSLSESLSNVLAGGFTGFFGGRKEFLRFNLEALAKVDRAIEVDKRNQSIYDGDEFNIDVETTAHTWSSASSSSIMEEFGLDVKGTIYKDRNDPDLFTLSNVRGTYKFYDPNQNVDQSFGGNSGSVSVARLTGVTSTDIRLARDSVKVNVPTVVWESDSSIQSNGRKTLFFWGKKKNYVKSKLVIFMTVSRKDQPEDLVQINTTKLDELNGQLEPMEQ